MLAFLLWAASMPIHLFDYPTREGVAPFHLYNLYNWILAVIREPRRVVTVQTALMAIVAYAIPGFLYIGLCYLVSRIVISIAYRFRRPSAHDLTGSNRNA